jgi:hypothetical protein
LNEQLETLCVRANSLARNLHYVRAQGSLNQEFKRGDQDNGYREEIIDQQQASCREEHKHGESGCSKAANSTQDRQRRHQSGNSDQAGQEIHGREGYVLVLNPVSQ